MTQKLNLALLLAEYPNRGRQYLDDASQTSSSLALISSVSGLGNTSEFGIPKSLKRRQRKGPNKSNFSETWAEAVSCLKDLDSLEQGWPVVALRERSNLIERSFLLMSSEAKSALQDKGLAFHRKSYEASWALSHCNSSYEEFEEDISREKSERISTILKEFDRALVGYVTEPEPRTNDWNGDDVIRRFLDAEAEMKKAIGPRGSPYQLDFRYEARYETYLKAMSQADRASRADKEHESTPCAGGPAPAAC